MPSTLATCFVLCVIRTRPFRVSRGGAAENNLILRGRGARRLGARVDTVPVLPLANCQRAPANAKAAIAASVKNTPSIVRCSVASSIADALPNTSHLIDFKCSLATRSSTWLAASALMAAFLIANEVMALMEVKPDSGTSRKSSRKCGSVSYCERK